MYRCRFLIAALTITALTIFLTVASSPTHAAPRTIPWDCSDWQESPAVADAADARVSMILESLATNRGKSIYCAIEQSDTWTKPKLGRPAGTATSGTTPSISANKATSAAFWRPKRAT